MFDVIRPTFYARNFIEKYLNNYKIVQRVIPVDYLLFDNVNSTIEYDRLQGGDYERFGSLSPLKYYYIRDFPIFLATEYTLNTSGEEFGIFSKTEIDCVITDLIVPSLFDAIIVKYGVETEMYKKFLPIFSVTNIETTSIYQKNFYKLKLMPSSARYEELLENSQQITGWYNFDEETKKFFEDKIFALLLKGRIIRQRYLDRFTSLYHSDKYSPRANVLLFEK